MISSSTAAPATGRLAHEALVYHGRDEYLAGTASFIRDGVARDEPVLVAVPQPSVELIATALGECAARVRFVDMAEAGRNPGRIIPAVLHAFVDEHEGRRVRIVGEGLWPGRTDVEYPRCVQHEALINLALAERPATILCPYDGQGLPPGALADAERTHPVLVRGSRRRPSRRYRKPDRVVESFNRPLAAPPLTAARLAFDAGSLDEVRRLVVESARLAGLPADRVADLQVAANELATNTVTHAGGAGVLRIWSADGEVTCEVADRGHLADRLAGRVPPPVDAEGGRGLLLVNYLCDLVEVYTGRDGTTIRLHMRR